MIVTSRSARAKPTARVPAQNETGWLLAVATAFLIVHIVALTIQHRVAADRTVEEQVAISPLFD